MSYGIPFLASLLLTFVLTGFARQVGIKLGFLAYPRKRDVHKKPIPRIGGIAIFLSFLLISVFSFLAIKSNWLTALPRIDKHITAIWLGSAIICITMLWDDIRSLKVWQKFLLQFLAILVVIASGIGIDTLSNPFGSEFNLNAIYIPFLTINGVTYHFSLLSDLLTTIWLLGMMNAINFVDGIDGLAAGQSVIAAITIFLLSISVGQSSTALLAICLAGSAFGFLFWNFPPAKIFMGDSGSMFLGFVIGVLALLSGGKLATVFLTLGFPIVDGLLVVAGRIMRRKNPFTTPDKTHLHHRFLEAGFKPSQAVIILYLISITFAWVALRSTTLNKIIASVLLIILVSIMGILLKLKKRKLEEGV